MPKITALPAAAAITTDDLIAMVDDPGGVPVTQKATIAQLQTLLSSIYVLKVGDTMTGKLVITQATANTSILTSTGYSLTAANAQNMLDFAGTLNTTGNPVALRIALTNTASGATTKFLEFLAGAGGATSVFSVGTTGRLFLPAGTKSSVSMGINGSANTGWFFDSTATAPGFGLAISGASFFQTGDSSTGLMIHSTWGYCWGSAAADAAIDTKLSRNAAGVVEVNNGTVGTFRDLKVRTLFTNNAASLVSTNTALTDAAGAQVGTLTNAPTAGPPAKWIQIDDNGTTRKIPSWI